MARYIHLEGIRWRQQIIVIKGTLALDAWVVSISYVVDKWVCYIECNISAVKASVPVIVLFSLGNIGTKWPMLVEVRNRAFRD